MQESKQAQLRRRYPTMELFNIALKAAGSKVALADQLGMIPAHISHHCKCLKNGALVAPVKLEPRANNCDFTDKEIDKRIKEMFGGKYEEVKVYKITDGYVPGQIGTDGLELVRTDVSRTSVNYWERGVQRV